MAFTSGRAADLHLVEDGKPGAEIIISVNPTRMQRVAAHEFRSNIEKITGARLPIVTGPSGKFGDISWLLAKMFPWCH